VAIDALGGKLERDVAPGECVLVGYDGQVHWHAAAQAAGVPTALNPCVFE
jgi:amidophosphoribosyltransferase